MSIEEFNTYMTNSIEKTEEIFSQEIILTPVYTVEQQLNDSIISTRATSSSQRWYYNNSTNGNYLRVTSSINYYGSTAYYSSSNASLTDCYSSNIYPYFIHSSDYDCQRSSDNRSLYLTLPGKKYPSPDVSAVTVLYTLQLVAGTTNYYSAI